MFKKLKLEVKLISDQEMYRMIQPNIWGGNCHASVRYAKANNKLMGEPNDQTKENSYILYIDANNFYGWAMSQALLNNSYAGLSEIDICAAETAITSDNKTTRFKFFNMAAWERRELIRGVSAEMNGVISNPPVKKIDFLTTYSHKVDFEYSDKLQDHDDDYPLAPEMMRITTEILFFKNISSFVASTTVPLLRAEDSLCSLLSKKTYVVHIKNLKWYLEQGRKNF